MTVIDIMREQPVIVAVGWALVHFLWQGVVIALPLACMLWLLRGRSANTRYLVACTGMTFMLLAPVVTMVVVWPARVETPTTGVILGSGTASSRAAVLLSGLTVGWGVGVLIFQTRLFLNLVRAARLRRLGIVEPPERWQTTIRQLAARMGISIPVRLVESTVARVPMLIGCLRPVILVPTAAFTGLTPEQLRTILVHELAHVRRHDYLVNLVQAVFETLLFYHPAVWWLSARIRVEREYCCDDMVVGLCDDTLCYARALAALDDMRCEDRLESIATSNLISTLASTGGSLMHRITRLAGIRSDATGRAGGWFAPLLIATSLLGAATALAVTTVRPRDVERATPTEQARPIDEVDVVGILRELGAEEAELIGFLRKAGLENDLLVMVLEEIDAEERVLTEIDRAERRIAFVESHMPEVRDKVAARLAAGEFTIPEAEAHLERARRELTGRFRAEERRHAEHPELAALEARLHAVREEVEAGVAAGRITSEDADRRLARVTEELHARLADATGAAARARDLDRALEARMAEAHDRIAAELERGRISEDEAHERLDRLQAESEVRRAWEHDALRGHLDAVTDRHRFAAHKQELHTQFEHLRAMQRDLEQAMANGTIDEAQAQQQLDRAERKIAAMQEHLAQAEFEVAERMRRAPRPEGISEAELERRQNRHAEITDRLEGKLRAVAEKLREAHERGDVTEHEARDHMNAVRAELMQAYDRTERETRSTGSRLPDVELQRRLEALHREVAAEVKAGRLSEQEAARKLEAVQQKIHEHLRPPSRDRLSAEDRALAGFVQAARAKLEAAREAGKITDEDAARNLERLERLEAQLADRSRLTREVRERRPEGERRSGSVRERDGER